MNPVWKIAVAEKAPLRPLAVNLIALDAGKAQTEIEKCFPGREVVSVRLADPFARSDEIKREYLNSGHEASDVDEAILQLMECGELFEDNEAALNFLMEEGCEDTGNPNENCLEGFECPTCGSYGPFRIWASKVGEVIVSDDGTEEDRSCFGDTTWEDDSGCTCWDCGNSGTVREFMGKSAPEFDAFQQIVANTYDGGEHLCRSPADIDRCGDNLLTFLMHELSLKEDCETLDEAITRINVAIQQLGAVRDGLEVASLDRMHLLSGWDVRFLEHKDDQFPLIFECQAESDEHAIEQAENAYPGCVIVSVSRFPESEEIKS